MDKYAAKAYSLIHNVSEELNLGDINKVDETKLPEFDLMTWGFPCQDISIAGNQKGIKQGETRSGLYYEGLRILKEKKPKYSIIENVKNLTGKKFSEQFKQILNDLEDAGYNNYWQVLNAKDYGIPQNRERVFIISIRKDIDDGKFEFNYINKECSLEYFLDKTDTNFLDDLLCDKILSIIKSKKLSLDKVIRIEDKRGGNSIHSWDLELKGSVTDEDKNILLKIILERRKGKNDGNPVAPDQVNSTKKTFDRLVKLGYLKFINNKYDLNFGNLSYNISKIISTNSICPTLTVTDIPKYALLIDNKIRKINTLEVLRLMGFDDQDYYILKENGISNTKIYKMAGNSIVVNVLETIFNKLLK